MVPVLKGTTQVRLRKMLEKAASRATDLHSKVCKLNKSISTLTKRRCNGKAGLTEPKLELFRNAKWVVKRIETA